MVFYALVLTLSTSSYDVLATNRAPKGSSTISNYFDTTRATFFCAYWCFHIYQLRTAYYFFLLNILVELGSYVKSRRSKVRRPVSWKGVTGNDLPFLFKLLSALNSLKNQLWGCRGLGVGCNEMSRHPIRYTQHPLKFSENSAYSVFSAV